MGIKWYPTFKSKKKKNEEGGIIEITASTSKETTAEKNESSKFIHKQKSINEEKTTYSIPEEKSNTKLTSKVIGLVSDFYIYIKTNMKKKFQKQVGIATICVAILIAIVVAAVLFRHSNPAKIFVVDNKKLVIVKNGKYSLKNNGRLILLAGMTKIREGLVDPITGLTTDALVLDRVAKMYQWDQISQLVQKELGTKILPYAIYDYTKTWSAKPINSADFSEKDEHFNPAMLIVSKKYVNKNVYIGNLKISPDILKDLTPSKNIMLSDAIKPNIKTDKNMSVVDGTLYIGNDIYSPIIGDYLISYDMTTPQILSMVGLQKGKTIVPYVKDGKKISSIKQGYLISNLYGNNISSNSNPIFITFILFIISSFLLFAGLLMISMSKNIAGINIPKLNIKLIDSIADAAVFSVAFQIVFICVLGLIFYGSFNGFLIAVAVAAIFLLYKNLLSPRFLNNL